RVFLQPGPAGITGFKIWQVTSTRHTHYITPYRRNRQEETSRIGVNSKNSSMTSESTKINPSEFGTITWVAAQIGEPRGTLRVAISAGHIETAQTANGTTLVKIESARVWASSERKRGRPAKSSQ
ncbi:MAG: hypothetical protein AAFP69_11680, partial [Planctomycetota bacterium]